MGGCKRFVQLLLFAMVGVFFCFFQNDVFRNGCGLFRIFCAEEFLECVGKYKLLLTKFGKRHSDYAAFAAQNGSGTVTDMPDRSLFQLHSHYRLFCFFVDKISLT